MTDDRTITTFMLKAVEFAADKHRDQRRKADWSRARRIEYLDWTERVVAGCRGRTIRLNGITTGC